MAVLRKVCGSKSSRPQLLEAEKNKKLKNKEIREERYTGVHGAQDKTRQKAKQSS
jgi:hypothetical protein